MAVIRSAVTGTGAYLPHKIVTNADLAQYVETSDDWIVSRTGIHQRHQAGPDEPTSELAAKAALAALENAGCSVDKVDLIIVATTTPDQTFPAVAALVQKKIKAPIGIAFDVQAVCTGFVYAMAVADGFVARGHAKCALVIGAECMTRLLDYKDRSTCVLFGDGAGAVVLEPVKGEGTAQDRGVIGFSLSCDGTKSDLLYVDGGVSTTGQIGHIQMQGQQVFRHAVVHIAEAVESAARVAGIGLDLVDWFIPHQANQRILSGVAEKLNLDRAKIISTVAEHANTSAASIPLALATAVHDGRIKPSQLLLIEAMGGGLTWGALALRL